MDLRDLVCGFGAIGALALLYEACRRFAAGWRDSERSDHRPKHTLAQTLAARRAAVGLGAVGTGLVVLLLVVFQARWHDRETPVFPIRPLNLNAAPAAIEVADAQSRMPEAN